MNGVIFIAKIFRGTSHAMTAVRVSFAFEVTP
jgi:hypothetical protein